MFQTLTARTGSSGNSEYVVQTSDPPFEKTKRRPSCFNCRQKKLRCIYKEDSCVKCLKQGLRCLSTGTSTRDNSSHSRLSSNGSDHEDTSVEDGYISSELTTSRAAPSDIAFQDLQESGGIDDMMLSLLDPSPYSHSSVLELEPGYNIPREEPSIEPTGTEQNISTLGIDLAGWQCKTNQTGGSSPSIAVTSRSETLFTDAARTEGGEPRSPNSTRSTCQCLNHIMCANETMQVKLIWGSGSPTRLAVSVEDMLQCQKGILASCESFLECKSCSLRSDYVMLVLSMCRDMVKNMADLDTLTMSGSEGNAAKRSSSSTHGAKSALMAGGWRLDDAIEVQVMRCLIGVRITRLDSLIKQLEKLINTHHCAYAWIVRDLKQAVGKKLEAIGHINRPAKK